LCCLCRLAVTRQGAKACEELKTEIAAKLDAKGVKGYTLDIVAKDADAGDAKVVGTCEGGTKKILYKRGEAARRRARRRSRPRSSTKSKLNCKKGRSNGRPFCLGSLIRAGRSQLVLEPVRWPLLRRELKAPPLRKPGLAVVEDAVLRDGSTKGKLSSGREFTDPDVAEADRVGLWSNATQRDAVTVFICTISLSCTVSLSARPHVSLRALNSSQSAVRC